MVYTKHHSTLIHAVKDGMRGLKKESPPDDKGTSFIIM